MFATQTSARAAIPRAARQLRTTRIPQQARFQSSTAGGSSSNASGSATSFASGMAGGVVSVGLFYMIYSYTPAGRVQSGINKTAKEANKTYEQAAKKLQEKTPDADQAYNYVKEFCYSYYVDMAFKDFETVREKNKDEADKLVNDAYKQFQNLAKSGLSLETARKAYDVLADLSKKLANLAGNSVNDLMDNHPKLKEQLGGNIDQLKQLGEQYGPEAKKQVDETWKQLSDIFKGGFSAASVDKARKLIQEKTEQVKKLGDEGWKKGLEQAKPYLDKYPQAKKLLEENEDALKQGNTTELFKTLSSSLEKKDLGGFEDYVKKTVDQAKSKGQQAGQSFGLNLDSYFNMIPQGGEILPKLKQMKEVAEKHQDEGEKLLKETMDEIKQVLEKKSQRAQEIIDKAKKESK
ncbi:Fungal specific transcription factor domain-containing protein [Apiospora phragmitis]|uniref:Fungal specific transcription factor domain-containing protein n=1 Tax=Apiospora phragmitis TaxID=2905665 RepID=A0ABR1VZQ0_9PEZI